MPRNLNRRVEVVYPILDQRMIQKIRKEILDTYLKDNSRARRLNEDGNYTRLAPADGEPAIDTQRSFLDKRDQVTSR
jgi:polyphosphate kinase